MSSPNVIIRSFYYEAESKNVDVASKIAFYSSNSGLSGDYLHYID